MSLNVQQKLTKHTIKVLRIGTDSTDPLFDMPPTTFRHITVWWNHTVQTEENYSNNCLCPNSYSFYVMSNQTKQSL